MRQVHPDWVARQPEPLSATNAWIASGVMVAVSYITLSLMKCPGSKSVTGAAVADVAVSAATVSVASVVVSAARRAAVRLIGP